MTKIICKSIKNRKRNKGKIQLKAFGKNTKNKKQQTYSYRGKINAVKPQKFVINYFIFHIKSNKGDLVN